MTPVVPTELRGRVFSLDMGLHTLASSICTFLLGKGRDDWELSPRMLAGTLGIVLFLPAILWTLSPLVVGKDLNEER